MPVIFNRPHANLNGTLNTPSVPLPQAAATMEIRLTKFSWPVAAQISASIEYSLDGEVTWVGAGGVTDDGTRTKDTYIRSSFEPPLPQGTPMRGHVTTNMVLDTGVTITVT